MLAALILPRKELGRAINYDTALHMLDLLEIVLLIQGVVAAIFLGAVVIYDLITEIAIIIEIHIEEIKKRRRDRGK